MDELIMEVVRGAPNVAVSLVALWYLARQNKDHQDHSQEVINKLLETITRMHCHSGADG